MKKFIALVLVLALLPVFAACSDEPGVLEVSKSYEITTEIRSLSIQINAADFTIEYGDGFSVESNLKYLSVTEKDGVLKIADEGKPGLKYTDPTLKLCIPKDVAFEEIDIITGAAKLTSVPLSADSIHLLLGAGKVRFEGLIAHSDIKIEGGAGEITVESGMLHDLDLTLGVGSLNMTVALQGENELKCGVGGTKLTLIGDMEDYKLDVAKGIGSITVAGEEISDSASRGNGQCHVEIEGGIGAVNVTFRAE